jgi:hypothetical protein
MGGMMGMFGGANSRLMLLALPPVQTELMLTDKQKEEITKLGEKLIADMRGTYGGLRDLEPAEREKKLAELRQKSEQRLAEIQKDVDKILLDHQKTRLFQIGIQVQGVQALADAEVAKKLGLSDDQKSQIATIQKDSRAATQKAFADLRNLSAEDRDAKFKELREGMAKSQKEVQDKMLKVLTEAQQKQFEELKGPAFKVDWSQMRPGFGRKPAAPPEKEKPAGQ